jgi:hypothetical protein
MDGVNRQEIPLPRAVRNNYLLTMVLTGSETEQQYYSCSSVRTKEEGIQSKNQGNADLEAEQLSSVSHKSYPSWAVAKYPQSAFLQLPVT